MHLHGNFRRLNLLSDGGVEGGQEQVHYAAKREEPNSGLSSAD